jgi:hypothetical protein
MACSSGLANRPHLPQRMPPAVTSRAKCCEIFARVAAALRDFHNMMKLQIARRSAVLALALISEIYEVLYFLWNFGALAALAGDACAPVVLCGSVGLPPDRLFSSAVCGAFGRGPAMPDFGVHRLSVRGLGALSFFKWIVLFYVLA